MNTQHTPGHWSAIVERRTTWDGDKQSVEIWAGDILIAAYATDYGEYPETDEENAANAFLMASAGAMKAALELIASTDPVDVMLDPQRAVRVAQKALSEIAHA